MLYFSKLLGITYCRIHCVVSHHSLLRCINHVLPSVIYQVLGIVLAIIVRPIILTKTHEACLTFSPLLGIRYCISYCGVSHHSLLRCMKHVLPSVIYQVLGIVLAIIVRPIILTKTHEACLTFSPLLGIRYCISYCGVSHHSLLRCMKHVLPSVIYQVLGIVLVIVVCPIIPYQDA